MNPEELSINRINNEPSLKDESDIDAYTIKSILSDGDVRYLKGLRSALIESGMKDTVEFKALEAESELMLGFNINTIDELYPEFLDHVDLPEKYESTKPFRKPVNIQDFHVMTDGSMIVAMELQAQIVDNYKENFKGIDVLYGHEWQISSVSMYRDGSILTADYDRKIIIHEKDDEGNFRPVESNLVHDEAVLCVKSNEFGTIISTDATGLYIWRPEQRDDMKKKNFSLKKVEFNKPKKSSFEVLGQSVFFYNDGLLHELNLAELNPIAKPIAHYGFNCKVVNKDKLLICLHGSLPKLRSLYKLNYLNRDGNDWLMDEDFNYTEETTIADYLCLPDGSIIFSALYFKASGPLTQIKHLKHGEETAETIYETRGHVDKFQLLRNGDLYLKSDKRIEVLTAKK